MVGIDFDCKLLMSDAAHGTVVSVSWKLRSIMRSRRFFCDADMVLNHKSHILSFIEYRTPGIYHACESILCRLDSVQRHFLGELGVSEVDALLIFNLAPLPSRRDMAMLGVIRRCVLGYGPEQLRQFFRHDSGYVATRSRSGQRRHGKQLIDPRGPRFSERLRRSALGLVAVYNLLPQSVVDSFSVSSFQSQLQAMLREQAQHTQQWGSLFSPRIPLYCHPLLSF